MLASEFNLLLKTAAIMGCVLYIKLLYAIILKNRNSSPGLRRMAMLTIGATAVWLAGFLLGNQEIMFFCTGIFAVAHFSMYPLAAIDGI